RGSRAARRDRARRARLLHLSRPDRARRGGEAVAAQEPVAPLVEREVALDIVRRGLMVAPVVVAGAGLIRGWDGAASAAIALALVLVNFLAAAAIMTRAAKSGPTAIGAAARGRYNIRLAVSLVARAFLRHQPSIGLATLRCAT